MIDEEIIKKCNIDNCKRDAYAKGLCLRHYTASRYSKSKMLTTGLGKKIGISYNDLSDLTGFSNRKLYRIFFDDPARIYKLNPSIIVVYKKTKSKLYCMIVDPVTKEKNIFIKMPKIST